MELIDKLQILTDSAKYDVACTSSGMDRKGKKGMLGSTSVAGICHSFAADGRCISLLKVLLSNYCVFDCQYCVNRRSNDVPRAAFSARELADLVIAFYKRNYIEGLFLSSGVLKNPDYTMERMCETLRLLREEYGFRGYIHAKTIPGASPELVTRLSMLADRVSVNLELPSEESLSRLCPDKPKKRILGPMAQIRDGIQENRRDMVQYQHTPLFAPAGQSTQIIIGATPDTDYQIVRLAQSLYKKYTLKRVFYSAYIPVSSSALLPQGQPVPLLREHRLYQADWLIRMYGFDANEILNEKNPTLDPFLDPKCNWALNNLENFPVEINRAAFEMLIRVPGIGIRGAQKIMTARRVGPLSFEGLRKLGIVLRRAAYFITCSGRYMQGIRFDPVFIYHCLTADARQNASQLPFSSVPEQLSLFAPATLPALMEKGEFGHE